MIGLTASSVVDSCEYNENEVLEFASNLRSPLPSFR